MWRTRILVLLILVWPNTLYAPAIQEQNVGGTWNLELNVGPGAPTFNYWVVIESSPGFEELHISPSGSFGSGLVVGPCELGPLGRANGLTWRLRPPTGIGLTFEVMSRRTPATIILRGEEKDDGHFEGTAIIIGEDTNPATGDFDPQIGFEVNRGYFGLRRAEVPCSG